MAKDVYGTIELNVSVPVEAESNTGALLEANLKLHPDLVVLWELTAVDCNGERHTVTVNECVKSTLDDVDE